MEGFTSFFGYMLAAVVIIAIMWWLLVILADVFTAFN